MTQSARGMSGRRDNDAALMWAGPMSCRMAPTGARSTGLRRCPSKALQRFRSRGVDFPQPIKPEKAECFEPDIRDVTQSHLSGTMADARPPSQQMHQKIFSKMVNVLKVDNDSGNPLGLQCHPDSVGLKIAAIGIQIARLPGWFNDQHVVDLFDLKCCSFTPHPVVTFLKISFLRRIRQSSDKRAGRPDRQRHRQRPSHQDRVVSGKGEESLPAPGSCRRILLRRTMRPSHR